MFELNNIGKYAGKNYITTFTGKRIDLLSPDPKLIDPLDIAHSLPKLCRWNGHINVPNIYSVASHSIEVALRVAELKGTKKDQRTALFHDSPESYLGDMISPLKYLPFMEGYRWIESIWWKAIADRFNCHEVIPDIVKQADDELKATEGQQFHDAHELKSLWNVTHEPLNKRLKAKSPKKVSADFLQLYYTLKG